MHFSVALRVKLSHNACRTALIGVDLLVFPFKGPIFQGKWLIRHPRVFMSSPLFKMDYAVLLDGNSVSSYSRTRKISCMLKQPSS
jgi:hypothetical protein